jgi:hypothetical protein
MTDNQRKTKGLIRDIYSEEAHIDHEFDGNGSHLWVWIPNTKNSSIGFVRMPIVINESGRIRI